MIPEAPIIVLLVVMEKADMYSFDGWLRTRYLVQYMPNVAERAHLDHPLRSTSLDHKLLQLVGGCTSTAANRWCCCSVVVLPLLWW